MTVDLKMRMREDMNVMVQRQASSPSSSKPAPVKIDACRTSMRLNWISITSLADALVSTGLAKLGYKYVNMMIVGLSILVIKGVTQESNERFHVLLTA
nr:hypothetical protein [Tanacetum cinerariifolium]